jgi:hypothetical protein
MNISQERKETSRPGHQPQEDMQKTYGLIESHDLILRNAVRTWSE